MKSASLPCPQTQAVACNRSAGLTITEAAELLGVYPRTLNNWRKRGWLPQAGRGRISRQDLIAAARRSPWSLRNKDQINRLEATADLGQLAMVPVAAIQVDPPRFQFREAASPEGTTAARSLGAIKWSPILAGVILLWRDTAGGVWLADGHHRLQLAKRCGIKMIAAMFIDAATDIEARTIAAISNIAAGHGSVIDTARFLANNGNIEQLEVYGLSVRGQLMKEASKLTELSSPILNGVLNGQIPLDWGQALSVIYDWDKQHALHEAGARRNWTTEQLKEAVAMAQVAAITRSGACGALPGFDDLMNKTNSNLDQILSVRSEIRKQLGREIRAMSVASGQLSCQLLEDSGCAVIDRNLARQNKVEATKVLSAFDQLVKFQGPIADLIGELAALVQPTYPASWVVTNNLPKIRAAINKVLGLN